MASVEDITYMRRALELAEAGRGLASPNPMVGAVLVRDGIAAGEGTHTYEGVRHAEIIAIEQAGERARGATLYINLEPCSHHGRTPPCVDALIRAEVGRVVAGMEDPNPEVGGRGLERLRQGGIRVDVGVLGDECRRLNEHFALYITRRPFVTLKAAMSLDGRIAAAPAAPGQRRSTRFTCPESLAYVHRLRHAHDALITGIGTVLADDPLLTDRSGLPRRRRLLRVVLDSWLRLPLDSRLVASANGDLLVIARADASAARAGELEHRGALVSRLGRPDERPSWPAILGELRSREITGALLEAGAGLNASAVESGVVNKFVLFYAPRLFGGDAPPLFTGGTLPAGPASALRITDLRRIGDDIVVEAYPRGM